MAVSKKNISTLSVKQWIESRPGDSIFWSRDMPGKPSTARAALSRLAADPANGIRRLAPGMYWRSSTGEAATGCRVPSNATVALLYAGPGAGFARWSAAYMLQWGHQVPKLKTVAVVGRRLQPHAPIIGYRVRRNRRRERLTWTEVSVLEALAMWQMIEYEWSECLEVLGNGWSGYGIGGLSKHGRFRPEAVVWAAETDELLTPDLMVMAEDIMRALPAEVHPVDVTDQNVGEPDELFVPAAASLIADGCWTHRSPTGQACIPASE